MFMPPFNTTLRYNLPVHVKCRATSCLRLMRQWPWVIIAFGGHRFYKNKLSEN